MVAFCSQMQYFSTNRKSPIVDFRDATQNGQPDDKGLYFPESIPQLSGDFKTNFRERTNEQIAFEVIRPYVGDSIPEETLFEICEETVNFPFPLVEISENISALELFHGPTLAFKDVGARFMSRCLRYFSREKREKTIVVVATSGDTGGAVAAGFFGVEGVEVIILYPQGRVSRVQELQLTTLGGNVTTLEVKGTFDDCQALAKEALADSEIKDKVFLTSANSINVARWLPQQFFYFYALKQWAGDPPIFAVPSGNLGNICAGLLANASGMPAAGFIAACNANTAIADFMKTGKFVPKPAVSTLSNAMDIGNPSNFVRVLEIFDNEFSRIERNLTGISVSDEQTIETIKSVYETAGYVLDPHGAVAYRALADHQRDNPQHKGIFLETAHPIKFDSVSEILGTAGEAPESVTALIDKKKDSIEIPVDYDVVKDILLSKV